MQPWYPTAGVCVCLEGVGGVGGVKNKCGHLGWNETNRKVLMTPTIAHPTTWRGQSTNNIRSAIKAPPSHTLIAETMNKARGETTLYNIPVAFRDATSNRTALNNTAELLVLDPLTEAGCLAHATQSATSVESEMYCSSGWTSHSNWPLW